MTANSIQLNINQSNVSDDRTDKIITMGQIIGMIKMVLTSIIEAIDKSGDVGKNYLEANLKVMRDSASYTKKAQVTRAAGAITAAAVGVAISGMGMVASVGSLRKIGKNAEEMSKIHNGSIAQPSKNIPMKNKPSDVELSDLGNLNARQIDKSLASKFQENARALENGKGFNAGAMPEKLPEPKAKIKAPHAKDKDGTYASEKERDGAFKIQDEKNKANPWSNFANILNPHTLPVGGIFQARNDDDAAKEEYLSQTERATGEVIKTLQGENGSFYGSLSSLIDKLGITNVITQTIIAASQWR